MMSQEVPILHIRKFGNKAFLGRPRPSHECFPMLKDNIPAYMTTATWSSMYLLMFPKKQAAMILTDPNAILERYTYL